MQRTRATHSSATKRLSKDLQSQMKANKDSIVQKKIPLRRVDSD